MQISWLQRKNVWLREQAQALGKIIWRPSCRTCIRESQIMMWSDLKKNPWDKIRIYTTTQKIRPVAQSPLGNKKQNACRSSLGGNINSRRTTQWWQRHLRGGLCRVVRSSASVPAYSCFKAIFKKVDLTVSPCFSQAIQEKKNYLKRILFSELCRGGRRGGKKYVWKEENWFTF